MSTRSQNPSLNIENLEIKSYENNIKSCCASNNLNTCLEMDSLLHIETKKQLSNGLSSFIQLVYLAKYH